MSAKAAFEPLRLLLLGASGAVGSRVLGMALADPRVGQVVAPTRRPLPSHPKLLAPVIDFTELPADAAWWAADAVVCALGTTMRAAGSSEAFAFVDRDLPIQCARLARQAGATRLALNSSLGASVGGNFYLRTKAQAEAGIRQLGYPSLIIVRPSLIDVGRTEIRPGERVGLFIARVFRRLIPPRYRAVDANRVAGALLDGVLGGHTGEQVVESEQLQP